MLVTGSLTARGHPNLDGMSDRTWITLEIPEPSASIIASIGLFALFVCKRSPQRLTLFCECTEKRLRSKARSFMSSAVHASNLFSVVPINATQ